MENVILSKITARFRAEFAGLVLTPTISLAYVGRYLLHCHLSLKRRNSDYLGPVSVYSSISMSEQRPNTIVKRSVRQQSHLMQRTYTVGCRGDEG